MKKTLQDIMPLIEKGGFKLANGDVVEGVKGAYLTCKKARREPKKDVNGNHIHDKDGNAQYDTIWTKYEINIYAHKKYLLEKLGSSPASGGGK